MESGGDYWDLAAFNQPTASFNEEAHHMMMYQGSSHHLLSAAGHRFPAVDPHLTCLKLGKRHYFEDVGERHHHHHLHHHQQQQEQQHVAGFKRGRGEGGPSSSSPSSVPKCQVEGCNVPLLNAKDYHRRHKVCEMHSKAPKVVVLGVEQRFCQQCSRFHVLSEFDDSKRSCRRRLAGHNERRRKSSNDAVARNPSQESKAMDGRFPCISASSRGRAHSLLSSKGSSSSWVSPSDLSSRSSAALQELIAENRAAVLARQLFAERSWQHVASEEMSRAQELSTYGSHQRQMVAEVPRWTQIQEPSLHVTLDLMQAQASSYGGILSGRSKSKEEDECSELWKSLAGTHVV